MNKKQTSPFIYGSTVSNKAFTNRIKESKKLFYNLTSGVNTTIISPRRWGKSSLVEKVFNQINKREKDIKTVVIDLFSVQSEDEFLELFAREVVKASSSNWEEWVKISKEIFKKIIPKISFGIDPQNEFNLSFELEDLIKHKDEILDLPEVIAKKKKIRFIIALDEFQNIATYKNYEALEKSMRSKWQRQKNVTYCLYGSKRQMMTDIFDNSSKPFYRFGDIMLLEKIAKDDWIKFITDSFKNTGKSISKKMAEKITELMKNHSWYVQQLSHYIWYQTHTETDVNDLNVSLQELINANTPLFQRDIESLSRTQLNLLKAIAMRETQLTSVAVMKNYRLGTPRNVSKNKLNLQKNDIINQINGLYEFLDPVFELWFLKQFFGKDFLIKTD
ncbi:MAG: ATP-binding protein [Flavobacteriaceae bacterium]|nr:ATP-binding protein [Flavobacteriaceae bacterium]